MTWGVFFRIRIIWCVRWTRPMVYYNAISLCFWSSLPLYHFLIWKKKFKIVFENFSTRSRTFKYSNSFNETTHIIEWNVKKISLMMTYLVKPKRRIRELRCFRTIPWLTPSAPLLHSPLSFSQPYWPSFEEVQMGTDYITDRVGWWISNEQLNLEELNRPFGENWRPLMRRREWY